MKKKLLLVLLTVALIIGTFSAFAIMTGAQTTEPEMKIAYCNLSFRDNVCIKYAVKSDASDVKILIWTSPDSEYTVGTHDDEITEYYTEDIGGVSHMIFDYTKLTAKQMTDVVYARVYAKVDGIDHYSEVNKYSILQYAYNKLGKTATASTDVELKEMLTGMLTYGASAQKYFDYKEDRLATSDWYQVKLTAGMLDDGCMHGLYLSGDKVTITAPETDDKGHTFSHWVNSAGEEIATTSNYELTVGTANDIYTPIYAHTLVVDSAVIPSCNETGLTEGSHCSVCGTIIEAQEIVPATGKHNFSEWQTIKEPTPTEEGIKERVCSCGEKETQTIEKLVQELAYTLNSDGKSYSVTGIGTWTDSDVVIPETYKGLPVTAVGYDAFDSKPITSVVIPDSVTLIDTDAFRKCENLTSVVLGNGIKTIEYSAFEYCISLTGISMPDSVTKIGYYAFNGCKSLSYLKLSNSISYMSSNAFSNCVSLVEVIIPNGVSVIGDYAFQYCSNLKFVSIPESVTKVGYDAFYGCPRNLAICIKGSTSITSKWNSTWNKSYDNQTHSSYSYTPIYGLNETGKTDNGLYWMQTYISSQDFSGEAIEIIAYSGSDAKLIIPETINGIPVKMIQAYVFERNTDILSITLPATLIYIGDYAFSECSNLTSITIPNSVTSIGSSAFYYCTSLTSITIPNSVTSIGSSAFRYCTGLTDIVISNSITRISDYAFYACYSLTNIVIPDSVTSIGDWAFGYCSELTSIVIPNSVTSIGNYVFNSCSSLSNIKYRGTIPQWSNISKGNYWNGNNTYRITYDYIGE